MNLQTVDSTIVSVFVITVAAACGGTTQAEGTSSSDQALCERASEHIRECMPDRDIPPPEECDPEAARRTLDSSCDELQSNAGNKKDGTCSAWTWWSCDGDDSDGAEGSSGFTYSYDFWVNTSSCKNDICDVTGGGPRCAKVALVDTDGEVAATEYTNGRGSVQFTDVEVPEGEYTVRVLRRDGEVAEMMAKEDNSIGHPGRAAAERTVTLEGGDDIDNVRFYFAEEKLPAMRRCASAEAELSSSCDGRQMSSAETEWSWIAELEGQNEAGQVVSYHKPLKVRDANRIVFSRLFPGEYKATFYAVDVADYDRENNLDQSEYADLVQYNATGREETVTFEVTSDDVGDEKMVLEPLQLDYGSCP